MESYDVLVVILAVTLAVFLTLAIVFTIYLIKIARRVNEITEKARSAVDSVEIAANIFKKAAAPAAFSKVLSSIIEDWQNRKSKKGDK